ncbi:MAG: hypothetical protein ABI910_16610, partial [Gemmatimonadota bacterium]
RVLRISLGNDDDTLADDEIFAPSHMEQGGIRSRMLSTALAGERDVEREQRRMLADGSLPPHDLGAAWHEGLAADVAVVLESVPGAIGARAVPFTIDGDAWRLKGRLVGVNGGERYVVRAGGIRAEHWIRAWVEHVAMCAAREAGVDDMPTTTVVVWRVQDKPKREVLPPVTDALGLLDRLVHAAKAGLEGPLPFFAQAGWTWHNAIKAKPKKAAKPKKGASAPPPVQEGGVPDDARWEATLCYEKETTPFAGGGDCEDPYVALCFRGVDPMADRWGEFERLAVTLFGAWRWAGGDEG